MMPTLYQKWFKTNKPLKKKQNKQTNKQTKTKETK